MKLLLSFIFLAFAGLCSAQSGPIIPIPQVDTVYTNPEVYASYPGGDVAWKKYVKRNLKYPKKAWWDLIEGDVAVKLVIEKDGTISNAWNLTTTGYGFEQEAIRLIKQSGKWIPARHRGQVVKSEGELTILFRLK